MIEKEMRVRTGAWPLVQMELGEKTRQKAQQWRIVRWKEIVSHGTNKDDGDGIVYM